MGRGGGRATKASVQHREAQAPLVRVKLPVALLGAPLFAGCTVGGAPEDLALHLGTLFARGPSIRLTYHPAAQQGLLSSPSPSPFPSSTPVSSSSPPQDNPSTASASASAGAAASSEPSDFARALTSGAGATGIPLPSFGAGHMQMPPLLAVIKAGLGRWGGSSGASLSLRLEIDVANPSNSRCLFKLEPRLGDVSIRRFPTAAAAGSPSSSSTSALPAATLTPSLSTLPAVGHSPRSLGAAARVASAPRLLMNPPQSEDKAMVQPSSVESNRVGYTTSMPQVSGYVAPTAFGGSVFTLRALEPSSAASVGPSTGSSGSNAVSITTATTTTTATSNNNSNSNSSASISLSAVDASQSSHSSPELSSAAGAPAAAPDGPGLSSPSAVAGSLPQVGQEVVGVRGLNGLRTGKGFGGVGVTQGLQWAREMRGQQGWDVAVHSSIPIGPRCTATARWRLRLPGDCMLLPTALSTQPGGGGTGTGINTAQVTSGAGEGQTVLHEAEEQEQGPAGREAQTLSPAAVATVPPRGAPVAMNSLGVTLSGCPMLMLDKIKVEIREPVSSPGTALPGLLPTANPPSSSSPSSSSFPSGGSHFPSHLYYPSAALGSSTFGIPFGQLPQSEGMGEKGSASWKLQGSPVGSGREDTKGNKEDVAKETAGKDSPAPSRGWRFWRGKGKSASSSKDHEQSTSDSSSSHTSSTSSSTKDSGRGCGRGNTSSTGSEDGRVFGMPEDPWAFDLPSDRSFERSKSSSQAAPVSKGGSKGSRGSVSKEKAPLHVSGQGEMDVSEELRRAILQAKGV